MSTPSIDVEPNTESALLPVSITQLPESEKAFWTKRPCEQTCFKPYSAAR